ncbi:MAG: hypothetical protein WA790_15175 [Sulfitobacter sp.]
MIKYIVVVGTMLTFCNGAQAQGKKDLIRQCVQQEVLDFQKRSEKSVSARGDTTCPAGDVVGFPPKRRKHNRAGEIVLRAGSGRLFCDWTRPALKDVSDNGGYQGNFVYSKNKDEIRLSYGCNGAGVGQGRRWWKGTLTANSCASVTQELLLDLTLKCAAKLN